MLAACGPLIHSMKCRGRRFGTAFLAASSVQGDRRAAIASKVVVSHDHDYVLANHFPFEDGPVDVSFKRDTQTRRSGGRRSRALQRALWACSAPLWARLMLPSPERESNDDSRTAVSRGVKSMFSSSPAVQTAVLRRSHIVIDTE